jgi:hypothetical protein
VVDFPVLRHRRVDSVQLAAIPLVVFFGPVALFNRRFRYLRLPTVLTPISAPSGKFGRGVSQLALRLHKRMCRSSIHALSSLKIERGKIHSETRFSAVPPSMRLAGRVVMDDVL